MKLFLWSFLIFMIDYWFHPFQLVWVYSRVLLLVVNERAANMSKKFCLLCSTRPDESGHAYTVAIFSWILAPAPPWDFLLCCDRVRCSHDLGGESHVHPDFPMETEDFGNRLPEQLLCRHYSNRAGFMEIIKYNGSVLQFYQVITIVYKCQSGWSLWNVRPLDRFKATPRRM